MANDRGGRLLRSRQMDGTLARRGQVAGLAALLAAGCAGGPGANERLGGDAQIESYNSLFASDRTQPALPSPFGGGVTP